MQVCRALQKDVSLECPEGIISNGGEFVALHFQLIMNSLRFLVVTYHTSVRTYGT